MLYSQINNLIACSDASQDRNQVFVSDGDIILCIDLLLYEYICKCSDIYCLSFIKLIDI